MCDQLHPYGNDILWINPEDAVYAISPAISDYCAGQCRDYMDNPPESPAS